MLLAWEGMDAVGHRSWNERGMSHLAVQHVQPKVRYLGNGLVATLQRSPLEERLKNAGLEVFHQLQFPTSFDLKSLESHH